MLQLVVRIIHSTQATAVVMVLIMKDLLMVTSTMVTISLVLVKNGMMVQAKHKGKSATFGSAYSYCNVCAATAASNCWYEGAAIV